MIHINNFICKYYEKSINLNNFEIDFYYIDSLSERSNGEHIRILSNQIYDLLNVSWGDFGADFINEHIIFSKHLVLAYVKNEIIGFIAVNEKKINKKKYYYFEFLAINPKYQNLHLSHQLMGLFFNKIFLKNILRFNFYLNLITISPNPKIMGMLYRRSLWMYPNPKKFDGHKLPTADKEIYEIAKNIIQNSHRPDRRLDKEGLVLHDSYKDMPKLIYDYEKIPWDYDEKINILCDKYLEYKKRGGKEFIIIAKIGLLSLKLFT